MHRKTIGGLCAAITLGLAGCGAASEQPSPDEFRARANAVCRQLHAHIRVVDERATSGRDVIAADDVMDREVAVAVRRLDALTPPPALEAKFARFKRSLAAQDAAIRALELRHVRQLTGDDRRELRAGSSRPLEHVRALGLGDC